MIDTQNLLARIIVAESQISKLYQLLERISGALVSAADVAQTHQAELTRLRELVK